MNGFFKGGDLGGLGRVRAGGFLFFGAFLLNLTYALSLKSDREAGVGGRTFMRPSSKTAYFMNV